jgi:signal transduction histidine kinase
MKAGRYILYIFIPVLAGLFYLLGWNCIKMYRSEKKQVQERVETAIKDAAGKIQWYNGSLMNSYALMLTDKDYDSKVAFAAGFTHNQGKMSIDFFSDDSAILQKDLDDLKKTGDTVVSISKSALQAEKMEYKPWLVMNIGQFDSLFKIELSKNKAIVPYNIHKWHRKGDETTKDTIVSTPFIIDFFFPHTYCIYYHVPGNLVLKNISPYLGSNLLLFLLLVLGTVFYYRSYRLQIQLSEFRESLFGNITHELKTPLTSMQLIIDDAKKNISVDTNVSIPSKHIKFAENELNRMKLIVDKILSFSKMSREQFMFDKEMTDLDHIISESITVMEISTQQCGGIIKYDKGNKISIPGDPILLENAVCAVIDNAQKYTSRPPEIDISLSREGQYVIIAIRDNGIGIPQHVGKKIFEPFFRVPTGNVYNTSGHGLGLSFVKQVMALHDGSISFASNENGTIFYLKFKVS